MTNIVKKDKRSGIVILFPENTFETKNSNHIKWFYWIEITISSGSNFLERRKDQKREDQGILK